MTTSSTMRVLHVDDDPSFAELVATYLERQDDRIAVETATGAAAAVETLATDDVDCVVSDYDMPEMNGLELLDAVREDHPDLPFILFTGKGSEEIASEAISAGVTDYLQKGTGTEQYELLANRVVDAVHQRHSQASYREVFEKSSVGLVVHDIDTGEIIDVNDRYCDLLGHDYDALVGRTFGDLTADVPGYGPERAREMLDLALEHGSHSFEWPALAGDGERRWVETTFSPATIRGRDRILAGVKGITERKKREERFKTLHAVAEELESSSTPTEVYEVLVDAAEDVLEYNLAIADAVEGDVLVAQAVSQSRGDEGYYEETPVDAEDNLAAIAYRTGESSVVEDLVPDDIDPADDRYRSVLTVPIGDHGVFQTVSTDVAAFDEADLELVETLVSHAGLTLDRIEQERSLRHRTAELERRNERLDEFASVVSHDLRNPLNVAEGRLELARRADDAEEHLEAVERAHDRMRNLFEDLLALARNGDSVEDTRPVHLGDAVEDCWRTVPTDDADLVVETDRTVEADSSRLKQLFENLLRNSVEHGSTSSQPPAGDSVEHGSTSSRSETGETPTRQAASGDAAHTDRDAARANGDGGSDDTITVRVGDLSDGFYVEDDGVGIPEDARDRAFETGFTTGGGTGFGLNIVRQVAASHGWEVSVTDGDDGGARFEVTNVTLADE